MISFFQLDVRALDDLNTSLYQTEPLTKQIQGTPDVTENDELVYTTEEGVYLQSFD